MPKIKACPYCELDDIIAVDDIIVIGKPWRGYHVACKWCGMVGPKKSSRSEAIAAWNNLPRKKDCE